MSLARKKQRLLVAVTGHGFGHATRTAEVVRELLSICPSLEVTISSTVPRRVFERRIRNSRMSTRAQSYEPGTVQKNCFEVDLTATRAVYRRYLAEREDRLRAEMDFVQSLGFSGVLADVPAIPLAAAARLGVPSAALWNFTWDWILEPILGNESNEDVALKRIPSLLRSDYGCAQLHLRLPFSQRETTLANVEDTPLVGRTSRKPRAATLKTVGLNPCDPRPIVLLAMGGWECRDWEPIQVQGCERYRFLVVGDVPLETDAEVTALPAALGEDYELCDLVAASDLVLSKAGYGIASECVLNRTPLLGVERRGFREAPELARDLRALGPHAEISLADFFNGSWETALTSLFERPREWKPVEENGARIAAARLRAHFQLEGVSA